jgi:hypothetical protein
MEDTMRDLLSKLDYILTESALNSDNPKKDYEAKKKALQDLQLDPIAGKDSEISQAIIQRTADLEKEAKSKGVIEAGIDFDQIRKDAEAHIKQSIDKQSDDRIAKLKKDKEDSNKSFLQKVGDKQIGMIKGAVKGAYKGFTGKEEIEEDIFQIGDDFGISFSEDLEIAAEITDILEDGIVIDLDETALGFLEQNGFTFEEVNLDEEKQKGVDGKACWKGYKRMGTKQKGGKTVDNCVKMGEDNEVDESGLQYYTGKKKYGKEGMAALAAAGRDGASEEELGRIKDKYKKEDADIDEAEYQGRTVPLGKPMAGDVKKSKVYVKNPQGNVVKVNFGDKKMRIKKSNPARRKSFRARHNCANPGPRHKARYWSCRAW